MRAVARNPMGPGSPSSASDGIVTAPRKTIVKVSMYERNASCGSQPFASSCSRCSASNAIAASPHKAVLRMSMYERTASSGSRSSSRSMTLRSRNAKQFSEDLLYECNASSASRICARAVALQLYSRAVARNRPRAWHRDVETLHAHWLEALARLSCFGRVCILSLESDLKTWRLIELAPIFTRCCAQGPTRR